MGLSETLRERLYRLTGDRRARIPFAVIGVLLLLTSTMVVGTMETREEPTTDVDASIVIDQTESMTQTAIRDGSQRAAEIAAEQPLTDPADNEWGRALNVTAHQTTIHPRYSDGTLSTDTFTNYLKALLYLEVRSDFERAGISDGDVETSVSLPAIENGTQFERAIERVTLREPRAGLLNVTIENVTITARHDGAVIEQRTQTMSVSIATPVLQLHERVSAYQDALDAGVMERGFSQRFNARIYALGWARGYAQNYRLPIVEVIANRHIEPSANSALFRTQQDIFGAADPDLENAVRLGWVCMAMQDGAGMFDQYMADNDVSYRNLTFTGESLAFDHDNGSQTRIDVPANVTSVEDLCNHAEWLFGDQVTGELPDAPTVTDLLGDAPGMTETDTITVGDEAFVPLARLTETDNEQSFQSAMQRIFTIDGAVRTRGTPGLPDDPTYSGTCANGSVGSWQTVSQEALEVVGVQRERLNSAETDGRYYRYQFRFRAKFQGQKSCVDDPPITDTSGWQVSNTLTTVVRETAANPGAHIDRINPELGIENKYEPGGPPVPTFRNYDSIQPNVTKRLLDEADASTDSFENWVSKQEYNVLEDSPAESFSTTKTVELNPYEFLDTALAGELARDISRVQTEMANISYRFNRTAYIEPGEESPFAQLMKRVNETMRETYLDREQPYESVGQKAIYEARYAYWQTLSSELAVLRGAHAESVGSLEDKLAETDSGVDDALIFLRQGVSASEPDPVPLTSPPVTDNITYEVSGSPTYLVDEPLTNDEVPAIEDGTDFSALSMKNREYFDLPYDEVIDDILQWVMNTVSDVVPGLDWGSPEPTISFRMAGDVLLAGELATETGDVDDRLSHNDTYDRATLEQRLDTFEGNVDDAIQRFEREMAVRTVTELYTGRSELVRCLSETGADRACEALFEEADDALVERLTAALDETERATERALDAYEGAGVDSTAVTAVQIGNGNASYPIRNNVTAALSEAQFYPDRFAGNYSEQQWEQVVESAVRPAFEQAASMRVEIGDDPEDAEWIDNSLQTALGNVSEELVDDRLETAGESIEADIENVVDENAQAWAGKWSGTRKRPARIPAGLPLLPIPGHWYATTNAWDINVGGEYARFEATANMGTPETVTATTYVREEQTVTHEIAGAVRELGSVEPIGFQGRSLLVVVTPPGVGVGDRTDTNPECSEHFPIVGPIGDRESDCTGRMLGVEWTEETQEDD